MNISPFKLSRYRFLEMAALCLTGFARVSAAEASNGHFVPEDKELQSAWIEQLHSRGERTWYSDEDLQRIGMPIGGICAGQVCLGGDGRLWRWDIFNQLRQSASVSQGFAIRTETGDDTLVRGLDREGFPDVRFCGEYPIGTVQYAADDMPVSVTLEAYSPFVPLDASASGLPATVMEFTISNVSEKSLDVTLAGWLENAVCMYSGQELPLVRRNRVERRQAATLVFGEAEGIEEQTPKRPAIVLADFEGKGYGDWKPEGEAFGSAPASGTLPRQQPVSGYAGKGLVNTFLGGDGPHGRLISPPFEINRNWITLLIGGGEHPGKTCVQLIVDGEVVREVTGNNNERLKEHCWDVRDLSGKQSRIEIVDEASGPWGHVNVDQIELRDVRQSNREGPLEAQEDFGTMGLAVLGRPENVLASAALPDGAPKDVLFTETGLAESGQDEYRHGKRPCGAVGKQKNLAPGETTRIVFIVGWCFPRGAEYENYSNREDSQFSLRYVNADGSSTNYRFNGNRHHELALRWLEHDRYYGNRFANAGDVIFHLAENFDALSSNTHLWHDTWYGSTLPHWLLERLFSTTSTLATSTCQRWANGRFWAWEGGYCCHGTCTHVWNYVQAVARLFPELERSAREMQDYGAGFLEASGIVRYRGEGLAVPPPGMAADGQAGTILKTYREHQMSSDETFLKRNWPNAKKALEFLIREDQNADGILEGAQHNTYDVPFRGANTMVGSLYLAALRAGEEMARDIGDESFAGHCRDIFERGSRISVERLFNQEYFEQDVDLKKYPMHQYANGCLSDQLFGQGWAHQLGLGYLYPRESVNKALRAVWKYNWAPDVGPHNAAHQPHRCFARPGEPGLFNCTWPRGDYLKDGVRYKNEVWTGVEYQVAGHLAWEGMATEALAICRGVHERYHPSKRNPWQEIECGSHYARGMASYGVFLALCGYEYNGSHGHLGMAPRLNPEDFRAAFTAAEGWGSLRQRRENGRQINSVELKWGRLRLKTFACQLSEGKQLAGASPRVNGKKVAASVRQEGMRVLVTFSQPLILQAGQTLEVKLTH